MSFPFGQTLQAFSPSQGAQAGSTLVIYATSNGVGAGEIVPGYSVDQSSTAQVNGDSVYQSCFLYNLTADGSRTAAVSFLLNSSGVNRVPPYYFLLASESGNLWLYSLLPTANASSFSASNVTLVNRIASFDTTIAAIAYEADLGLIYLAGSNGNLYTYNVGWTTQNTPVFSYLGANKDYTSTQDNIVTLMLATLAIGKCYLIATGLTLTDSSQAGSFLFLVDGQSPVLADGTWIPGTDNSVGTVVDMNTELIYAATSNSLISHSFAELESQGSVLWSSSEETILSLSASANPDSIDGSQFSQGALFMATSPSGTPITDTTPGSIYTFDPASGLVSPWLSQVIDGAPYTLCADQNLHVLVSYGLTGLFYASIVFTEGVPSSAILSPNTSSTITSSTLSTFASVAKLLFSID
jgi:hypothetical protein